MKQFSQNRFFYGTISKTFIICNIDIFKKRIAWKQFLFPWDILKQLCYVYTSCIFEGMQSKSNREYNGVLYDETLTNFKPHFTIKDFFDYI